MITLIDLILTVITKPLYLCNVNELQIRFLVLVLLISTILFSIRYTSHMHNSRIELPTLLKSLVISTLHTFNLVLCILSVFTYMLNLNYECTKVACLLFYSLYPLFCIALSMIVLINTTNFKHSNKSEQVI